MKNKSLELFVVILASVWCTIGGNMMEEDVVFYQEKGTFLKDHVISTHHVTTPIDCSFLCTSVEKCESYNYKPRGPGEQDLCQLNNATRQTKPLAIVSDAAFNHYTPKLTYYDCLAYLKDGFSENGVFTITDDKGNLFPAYCDFTSEPRSAWTLIMSHAFKMSHMPEFCTKELSMNVPLQENNPNWERYRLPLSQMYHLSNVSSHVRISTGFSKFGIDFTDYMRAQISDINILKFTGNAVCKTIEYINVRENIGEGVTAPFWQSNNQTSIFHVNTFKNPCDFDATSGAAPNERNFGMYCANKNETSREFRGTADPDSTTEYWFGGYV
ncbi:uncharacterized protein LOC110242458 [Exaiptasia diaphana]|uniref:Apple domain-containing protein n=1 Tax=Exaiptasia diaphana TaxID=2652724 RepID=A0A913XFT8_EXADI|nr:uncharacterized protein LOC110242458 [Exaiptasia diaphana]KXJ26150.1 hypothetical protein AC249_AIPGENE15813 [Exaiptasia diaphana]